MRVLFVMLIILQVISCSKKKVAVNSDGVDAGGFTSRISSKIDSDYDGISDLEEIKNKTDHLTYELSPIFIPQFKTINFELEIYSSEEDFKLLVTGLDQNLQGRYKNLLSYIISKKHSNLFIGSTSFEDINITDYYTYIYDDWSKIDFLKNYNIIENLSSKDVKGFNLTYELLKERNSEYLFTTGIYLENSSINISRGNLRSFNLKQSISLGQQFENIKYFKRPYKLLFSLDSYKLNNKRIKIKSDLEYISKNTSIVIMKYFDKTYFWLTKRKESIKDFLKRKGFIVKIDNYDDLISFNNIFSIVENGANLKKEDISKVHSLEILTGQNFNEELRVGETVVVSFDKASNLIEGDLEYSIMNIASTHLGGIRLKAPPKRNIPFYLSLESGKKEKSQMNPSHHSIVRYSGERYGSSSRYSCYYSVKRYGVSSKKVKYHCDDLISDLKSKNDKYSFTLKDIHKNRCLIEVITNVDVEYVDIVLPNNKATLKRGLKPIDNEKNGCGGNNFSHMVKRNNHNTYTEKEEGLIEYYVKGQAFIYGEEKKQ